MAEKRLVQYNYVYVCRICKNRHNKSSCGQAAASPSVASGEASPGSSKLSNDDSNDCFDGNGSSLSSAGGNGPSANSSADLENNRLVGLGKGKPMAALGAGFPGKRRRGGGGGFLGLGARPKNGGGFAGMPSPVVTAVTPTSLTFSWKNHPNVSASSDKPGVAGMKRGRVGDFRRQRRAAKLRLVGLQVSDSAASMTVEAIT